MGNSQQQQPYVLIDQPTPPPDISKKIVVCIDGDRHVGKSTIEHRLRGIKPTEPFVQAFPEPFFRFNKPSKMPNINVWCIDGSIRFREPPSPRTNRSAQVYIFPFDLTSRKTYALAKNRIESIKADCNMKPKVPVEFLLIENKLDCENGGVDGALGSRREVPENEAAEWAYANGVFYMEASAKTDPPEIFIAKLEEVIDKLKLSP